MNSNSILKVIGNISFTTMIVCLTLLVLFLYQNTLLVIYPPEKHEGKMILLLTERTDWPYNSSTIAIRYSELEDIAHEWMLYVERNKVMLPYSKYVDQFVSEGFNGVWNLVIQDIKDSRRGIPLYRGKIEKMPQFGASDGVNV